MCNDSTAATGAFIGRKITNIDLQMQAIGGKPYRRDDE